ncbi:uncharacterized protein LOC127241280 isoform X2 [Andrographis paniculata]|uniref:uncharacterized protein LOC127241280 isoform X2 n=1 Tax=Andrographis paniculata TaxID=175694 RepID=UPI0021E758F7|nr:uncharacterized protein LOC127241280 isoform X2 [Andrographis paniculata]
MKKLFFFRSNSSSKTNDDQLSPPTDKQVSWEKPPERADMSANNKHEDWESPSSPCLRRSLSFSSGSPYDAGGKGHRNEGDRFDTPHSNKQPGQNSSRRRLADAAMIRNPLRVEKFDSVPRACSDTSEISSNCSSSVLDRYIDGEQQMGRCESQPNSSKGNQLRTENAIGKRPPRIQYPMAVNQKPKSQSFRKTKAYQSSDKTRTREVHPDGPITIQDVYGRTFNRCSNEEEDIKFFKNKYPYSDPDMAGNPDFELLKMYKEAEERAAILSEELVNGTFLHLNEPSLPTMIQTIQSLTEEKLNMALEITAILDDRIAEKALFTEKLNLLRVESEARTRRLEMEKTELQRVLETELDRRSTDWSLKLEKYQSEEQRLRDRVRELAEQNVSLQREVCSSNAKENQLGNIAMQAKEAMEENHYLHKTLSETTEKTRAAEEERDCIRRNYEGMITECKDMHQSICRLQRIRNEQEKTISGLRELCDAVGSKNELEKIENLRIEHMRLTGVEHALRKEVEECHLQVNSLRKENIDLLNRLTTKNGNTFSTFKLDQELRNRIGFLQDKMLPFLTESSQLGEKLLDVVKTSPRDTNSEFLVECEAKIRGLRRATENFGVSFQTLSGVLQEKSGHLTGKSRSIVADNSTLVVDDDSHNLNKKNSEDVIRSALKAETLLTNLLRDKLYSKEQEMEQLRAELAAAVRSKDILDSTVDDMSIMSHKMKDFELQAMRKDETISQLRDELQEWKNELGIVRGVLAKVSEERDMMWEKVKHYGEDNMLLSGEVDVLRKKIEALDDEIMLKEGQISILKDSMSRPFDLLTSPALEAHGT